MAAAANQKTGEIAAEIIKITCPSCDATYRLNSSAIPEVGRKMKCARCKEIFLAEAPRPIEPVAEFFEADDLQQRPSDEELWNQDLAQEIDEDPENSTQENESSEGEPNYIHNISSSLKQSGAFVVFKLSHVGLWFRRLSMRQKLSVVGSLTLPYLLIGVLIIAQNPVIRAFPDLASLYALVGIEVNTFGLNFDDVRAIRRPQNGVETLVVEGRIENITPQRLRVPALELILEGRDRNVYAWQEELSFSSIEPNQREEFQIVLNSPPDIADRIRVRFAEGRTAPSIQ